MNNKMTIKTISIIEFNVISSQQRFERKLLAKDYYITLILYLIKDVQGIYFKGGTAINKIFLNHSRLSEDIDFTLTKDEKEVKKEILEIIEKSGFFTGITEGKNVDGFLRMIIKFNSELGEGEIFIDLNKRATLLKKPEEHKINHFYSPFIPEFSIKTLAKEEMIAEKLKATITRNKPRDHYDIYMILKNNLPINVSLAEEKCKGSGEEFSIIRMFNKANKLKYRWDKDMVSLIAEPITFEEVIKFLAKHFNLKEHKNKIKEEKKSVKIKK
jgi:predicted nucleotidyltransferase component of viral defense system